MPIQRQRHTHAPTPTRTTILTPRLRDSKGTNSHEDRGDFGAEDLVIHREHHIGLSSLEKSPQCAHIISGGSEKRVPVFDLRELRGCQCDRGWCVT